MIVEGSCFLTNINNSYSILPLADGVWAIEMKTVRAFLVAGTSSALLIDTGAGGVNLRQAVAGLTNLPVSIVNTHSHYDHISGNASFDIRFAHPRELAELAKAGYHAHPVSDGNGFDLGGRMLQALSLPGHSPGSIGLWDAKAGLLFAGDTIAKNRPVFLSLDGASAEAYLRTLDRILSLEHDEHGGTLTRIFCCHGDVECGLETVRALKELVLQYAEGEKDKETLPEKYQSRMPDTVGIVRQGEISFLV